MNDVTVLVNTSDGFADCWQPFFKLFSTFWPDCPYSIVLNTETLDYSFEGVELRTANVGRGTTKRLSWSQCLARCLDGIDTPYVLYLQEDFFLEAPVRAELVETFLHVMREGRADVIRLMECGGSGPWRPTDDSRLWAVDQRAAYRIALQAALWRKATLRKQLRMHESAWQLEVFGSARARRSGGEIVLCAARDRFHGPGREIFPYRPTGVVKGRWERDIVVPLFAAHGIEIDYSKRGFYDASKAPGARAPLVRRVADRARSLF